MKGDNEIKVILRVFLIFFLSMSNIRLLQYSKNKNKQINLEILYRSIQILNFMKLVMSIN